MEILVISLVSALVSGTTSAAMGGNFWTGFLIGGVTGGLTAGIGGMIGAAGGVATGVTPSIGASAASAAGGTASSVGASTVVSSSTGALLVGGVSTTAVSTGLSVAPSVAAASTAVGLGSTIASNLSNIYNGTTYGVKNSLMIQGAGTGLITGAATAMTSSTSGQPVSIVQEEADAVTAEANAADIERQKRLRYIAAAESNQNNLLSVNTQQGGRAYTKYTSNGLGSGASMLSIA